MPDFVENNASNQHRSNEAQIKSDIGIPLSMGLIDVGYTMYMDSAYTNGVQSRVAQRSRKIRANPRRIRAIADSDPMGQNPKRLRIIHAGSAAARIIRMEWLGVDFADWIIRKIYLQYVTVI